ncbi:MAG: acyl-CoA synthetase [Nocardioides sp.]|nr:acyl-CoA synthetase [Nocardioides sp.]
MTSTTTAARPQALAPDRSPLAPPIALAAVFAARARTTPERPALTFEGRTSTYADVARRIAQLAEILRVGGVQRGERVAYLGLNHPTFLEALVATASLGAVFVPLNYRLSGAELAYALTHSETHTLIADAAGAALVDPEKAALPVQRYLVVDGARNGWEPLEEAMGQAQEMAEPVDVQVDVHPDEPALIMYTSGTTGRPKGVTLTHANLWWNNICTVLALQISGADVSVVCAPLFHIGGLNVTTLATWVQGGHLVLHPAFDPARVLEDLVAMRATTMFGVPIMCQAIAGQPGFADADLSALRLIITGGAPVPVGLIRTYRERDIDLAQGYGLTEAAPIASFLTPEYALTKTGSAGRPMLLCDVRIADGDGNPVDTPGQIGEIEILGPNVTPGYWNNVEASVAAFNGDWLRTGDAGYLDDEGFLFITDRIQDMIITGGENVYPAEIEEVLFEHPAVAEVAVIGRQDERWGERVCAVVRLEPGHGVTLEELRDFAGSRVGRYKLPTEVIVIDELPRNAAGKVLKTELRTQFR